MDIKYKPWGKEVWLELNDNYCYKRIYINKGYRTSLQYHEKKKETNYLISGQARIYFQNEAGQLEQKIIEANEYFTVPPGRLHRVEALTDIILQEVSTPEVNDVIRVEDDTNRANGVVASEQQVPAVCILAAGIGSRMQDLTLNTNKCLLPINNVALITKVINNIPKEYDIVIAVGYKSNLVKSYCDIAHKDRNIIYVDVDKFIGVGSGPGYSITKCKEHLQRPFYFAVSDGFVEEQLPPLDYNWIGIAETTHPETYSTVDVDNDFNVTGFMNKSKDGYEWAANGLFGILDYKTFWSQLEKNMSTEGEIVSAFYDWNAYKKLKGMKFTWHDIGNKEEYEKINVNSGLAKTDGSNTYEYNNRIIKIFPNKEVCANKIKRAQILGELVPKIEDYNEHTFCYQKIPGKTAYHTSININGLLDWLKNDVWQEKIDYENIEHHNFYWVKTSERLQSFLNKKKNIALEQDHLVNGAKTQSIHTYLKKGLDELSEWHKTNKIGIKNFHGDLQFDNIIVTDEGKYKLIDWRDTFGKTVEGGDLYYDLAKMYGGILMSYNQVKHKSSYELLYINEYELFFNHKRESEVLQGMFEKWINDNGYSMRIIKIITALIYLNMCALHEDPLDEILFFKSKLIFNNLYNGN